MSKTITLTDIQVEQIILCIDLMENTLEGYTEADLAKLDIGIDKAVLFELATQLEELNKENEACNECGEIHEEPDVIFVEKGDN